MGRIILGDSQQNRASRALPTAGYEQRRSIMEGGDKWTPNDLVTIAKYAAGAGDYLAPFMAKDKGNTFLNGVTDQIAGGSNPDLSRMTNGMSPSYFGQSPEDINSMVSGLALSDFEQAPVTGIKPPMPLIPATGATEHRHAAAWRPDGPLQPEQNRHLESEHGRATAADDGWRSRNGASATAAATSVPAGHGFPRRRWRHSRATARDAALGSATKRWRRRSIV
jgi:hypothetical protein